MIVRMLLAVCFASLVIPPPTPGYAAPAPDSRVLVLDTPSVWRMHHTLRPPVLQQPDGTTTPLLLNVEWLDWETTSPPADWTTPAFNDRAWMRGPARRCARTPYLARLSMRGKFEVTDPSAVAELSVAVEYYGGAIVYLNGKEFGRANLPAGEGPNHGLADPYPLERFADAEGKLYGDYASRETDPKIELRTRRLEASVPKGLLRKGINVLAIDIVRAPYPGALQEKKARGVGGSYRDPGLLWNTCEIRTVRLSAGRPGGLVPNTTRPEGLQVWNADTLAADVDVDYGDRTEPLEPIALSGPRNGIVYGKVIIGRNAPIKNLRVTAVDLTSDAWTIPSSQVSFLYGVPGGAQALPRDQAIPPYPDRVGFLHALVEEPPDEVRVVARSRASSRVNGALVPLWVRVRVPRDCPVGDYTGTVTVAVADEPQVQVPVDLTVLPWTVPDPQDFRTWVELVQSPDTLAVEYGVPLWSDEHFALIARSFELVSDTGARGLYVPAIAHTNLGNEQSMIRWIKQGDGTYDWDFSVMDRYLDTAEQHLGTPKIVVLQVWEVYMNTKDSTGRRFGLVLDDNQKNTGGAPLVTFVDAAGNTENGTIPRLSDPASKPIWQELLTKVRERLEERGLGDKIVLGIFTDSIPNKEDTQFFLDIAPDLTWTQQGHNAFSSLHGMVDVGYTATWWSGRFADDLVNRRSGAVGKTTYKDHETVMTSLLGWNRPRLDTYYPRMANERHPLSYWRFLCETAITSDFFRGIGRTGADFWPAIKREDGRRAGWVDERFDEVAGYLHQLHSYVLEAGDAGPVAMNRLVALQQGIQECEARIYIEDALVNRGLPELAPDLAERCRQALHERLLYMWKGLDNMQFGGWGVTAWRFQPGVSGHAWLLNTAHQERTKTLYTLAGEVQQVLGEQHE